MILSKALEQDIVGLRQLWIVQQVRLGRQGWFKSHHKIITAKDENLWNGKQECDESVECIVQSLVPIQPERKQMNFCHGCQNSSFIKTLTRQSKFLT